MISSLECSDQVDIVLLVDASGSIRSERFPHVINFLKSVIGNITVGVDNAHVGKCIKELFVLAKIILACAVLPRGLEKVWSTISARIGQNMLKRP